MTSFIVSTFLLRKLACHGLRQTTLLPQIEIDAVMFTSTSCCISNKVFDHVIKSRACYRSRCQVLHAMRLPVSRRDFFPLALIKVGRQNVAALKVLRNQ